MNYTLDSSRCDAERIVHAALNGSATYERVAELFNELTALAAQHGPLSILVDETALEAGIITPGEIRKLIDAWNASGFFHGSRMAVFAPTLALYGVNRMFEMMADDVASRYFAVFRERREAEAWLAGAK